MTTERFVGRGAELEEIGVAVDRAMGGRGGMVLIAGEPGIGKTRLCEAAVRRASTRGVATAWASCWEGPTFPFWPWTQLVRSVSSARADDLPEAIRAIGGEPVVVSSGGFGGGDSELVRVGSFDALTTYLREAANDVPLLLVVDDLHWADVPSLRLLDYAATEFRASRIAFIGTYRDVEVMEAAEVASVFEQLGGKGQLVRLDGLSKDDVRALIETTTGSAPSGDLASAVHEQTGGNPLFVRELARLLVAQNRFDDPPASLPLPEGVRGVIHRRVARLPQTSYELLQTAAVFGFEFRADLLARASGVELASVLEHVDRAEAFRLVGPSDQAGRFSFSHALVREVLYDSLPSSKRAFIHERVGNVLESGRADLDTAAAELAHHFLQALPAGDPRKAIEYSVRAARRSLSQLAYEEAVVHLRRALDALELSSDDERRSAILLELGDAVLRAGDLSQARAVFAEAAAIARRSGRASDLAVAALGFGAGLSGFEVQLADRVQLDLLEEALASLPDEDSSLRAWLLARLSVARALLASVGERRNAATEAVAIARRVGDRGALAYALSALCDASAGPADAEARLDMAGEIVRIAKKEGDRPLELLGRRLRVVAYLETGDVSAVDAEINAFEVVSDALRQPLYAWYVPLWQGMMRLLSGDFAEAEHLASEAEEVGGRARSTNARMLATVLRFMIALQRNVPAEARRIGVAMVELLGGVGDVYNELFIALCDALAGETERVRPFVRRYVDTFATIDVDSEWLATCCQFTEVIFACREPEAAEALYASLLPHRHRFAVEGIAAAMHGSVELHLGLLADVSDRGDEAISHLEAAVAANTRVGAPVLVARAQLELATVLAKSDQRERASAIAAEAKRVFDRLGIDGWRQRADELAAPDGVSTAVDRPPEANVFRRSGELWTVAFEGAVVHVRDSKGIRDLAVVLRRPGEEVAALDLASERGVTGLGPSDVLSAPGDTGEVLDASARAAYKARLLELEEEIASADELGDIAAAERARIERDVLAQELASAYGLGGRARRSGDPGERARTTVTRRIKDAIARIEDVHPVLGKHLRNSIRTGTFCSYAPERPIDWEL